MKIGLVTGEYPPLPGGVGDFTRALGQALTELGHTVQVITGAGQGIQTAAAGETDGSVQSHRVMRGWGWASLLRVRRIVLQRSLDLVNIQYQAAAYEMGLPIHFLPKLAGVPCVVTFHDLRVPYLFPKAGPLRWWVVLALARSAHGVIVTNPEDEGALENAGGIRRLAQIPIGSNIAPKLPVGYARAAWRAQMGVAAADYLVGYFGFLNASKGGETLVRALARLVGQGRSTKLLLIGGQAGSSDPTDAAYGARVQRLIDDLGLSERIVRTGFVAPSEVSANLSACDVLALPYRDGVSFRRGSFMAALAHGCPIVSTLPAVPYPRLRDGENIRLVPPDDEAALGRALAELMDAPSARARLGKGARALADEFTWGKIAAQTTRFFEAALA